MMLKALKNIFFCCGVGLIKRRWVCTRVIGPIFNFMLENLLLLLEPGCFVLEIRVFVLENSAFLLELSNPHSDD
jgi:hypothetical protein